MDGSTLLLLALPFVAGLGASNMWRLYTADGMRQLAARIAATAEAKERLQDTFLPAWSEKLGVKSPILRGEANARTV
jgi:hypothetical protein